jgi:allophanate hydrolase subunit 2
MIRVIRPGMLTSIQDAGRRGFQHLGVTIGGAMDDVALRLGNTLVANAPDAAAIEVTLLGPRLEFVGRHLAVISGADLDAHLDGTRIECWTPFVAERGSILNFGSRRSGCRAYLCVAGGIDVPVVLGGRGTDLAAGFGGVTGRSLAAGDELPVGDAVAIVAADDQPIGDAVAIVAADDQPIGEASAIGAGRGAAGDRRASGARSGTMGGRLEPSVRRAVELALAAAYQLDAGVIRVTDAPESGLLDDASRKALVAAEFTVSTQSNRMGYRLTGSKLSLTQGVEMISSPVAAGTVQLPPGGDPIVLMADRQTTGGYPRVANVITADICRLAQLAPGDSFRFHFVTHEEARERLAEQNATIDALTRAMGAT